MHTGRWLRVRVPVSYTHLDVYKRQDYARNMPLPFDVDADIIDIQPEDYGLWYIDATGDPMK